MFKLEKKQKQGKGKEKEKWGGRGAEGEGKERRKVVRRTKKHDSYFVSILFVCKRSSVFLLPTVQEFVVFV